jgi:hypothetical protein
VKKVRPLRPERRRERQPEDVWTEHGLKPPEKLAEYLAYADFIDAHMPAVGDHVVAGEWPLSMAVAFVMEHTDCTFPCENRPLTEKETVAFLQVVRDNEPEE